MERTASRRNLALLAGRAVAFQAVFLILHFAYDWWPNGLAAIFGGVDESVFQHMKIGYFSWLVLSAGEWAAFKPSPFADFAASRLLGAVLMPFVFAAAWYVAAATIGPLPSDPAEILWANLVILASSLLVLGLQDHVGARPRRRR